jgi:hypothetical protein
MGAMSEFVQKGFSPESEERAAPPDALTLPFKGNPWLGLDKQSNQIVLHADTGERTIESGYQAILELAKGQNVNPEQAVAEVIRSLAKEREAGLTVSADERDPRYEDLSSQYGMRLGLFLGNEPIIYYDYDKKSSPRIGTISWKTQFDEGRPWPINNPIQPFSTLKFPDSRVRFVARSIERMEKELGVTGAHFSAERTKALNYWEIRRIPKVKQECFVLIKHTDQPRPLRLSNELELSREEIELPDPDIMARCNEIYLQERTLSTQKK